MRITVEIPAEHAGRVISALVSAGHAAVGIRRTLGLIIEAIEVQRDNPAGSPGDGDDADSDRDGR